MLIRIIIREKHVCYIMELRYNIFEVSLLPYQPRFKKYYSSLQMGLPANYYDGRNNPDLTPWINFFLQSMKKAYAEVVNTTRSFAESAKAKLAGLGEKDKRLLLLAIRFDSSLKLKI